MASEQLNKVIERIKSQPQNPDASMEQRRAGMERISERVPADVICEKVNAGDVSAEWIAAPGAAAGRGIRAWIDQHPSRHDPQNRASLQRARVGNRLSARARASVSRRRRGRD